MVSLTGACLQRFPPQSLLFPHAQTNSQLQSPSATPYSICSSPASDDACPRHRSLGISPWSSFSDAPGFQATGVFPPPPKSSGPGLGLSFSLAGGRGCTVRKRIMEMVVSSIPGASHPYHHKERFQSGGLVSVCFQQGFGKNLISRWFKWGVTQVHGPDSDLTLFIQWFHSITWV